ncbi:MAG TPA: PLD nuclease N-terminal domain-containing protein [Solirubrobacteraceae bacterium]|nr:PLD nuclease N-terminal domain-containing protein [Solirubrobacteraceae bacterium]
MSLLWGTIAVLAAIVWAITIYDVIRRHLGGKHTAGWLLLVIVLPFVGSLIYWTLRKPTPDELQKSFDAQRGLQEEAARRSVDSTRV